MDDVSAMLENGERGPVETAKRCGSPRGVVAPTPGAVVEAGTPLAAAIPALASAEREKGGWVVKGGGGLLEEAKSFPCSEAPFAAGSKASQNSCE